MKLGRIIIEKIISGGQTGVDRAALDAAIQLQIPHAGWCPKNRRAEDGVIAKYYSLRETTSEEYNERTTANVQDSDGTLILADEWPPKISAGTQLTIEEAKRLNRPYLIITLPQKYFDIGQIKSWLLKNQIKILNIAGPRESQSPGIYQRSFQLLYQIFSDI